MTAVEWLASNLDIVWEEKIIDLVEQAKQIEKEQMICFHNWMMKNDTPENAERYFHYTDNDMIREHYKETYKIL
jgi:hypothetical protein